jgi:hypothetical protein
MTVPRLPSPLVGEADSGRQARVGEGPPGMERSASVEDASWQPLAQSRSKAPYLDVPPPARPSAETRGERERAYAPVSQRQRNAAWFKSQGDQVLRFGNGQVLYEPESVLDTIYVRMFQPHL